MARGDSASKSEQLPIITIAVTRGRGQVSEELAEHLAEETAGGIRKLGMIPKIEQTSIVNTSGRDSIRIGLSGSPLMGGPKLRPILVFIPGGEKACAMGCTASEADFASHRADFEAALASLQVEGSAGSTVAGIPDAVAYGAGSVLTIAIVLYVLSKVFSKPKRSARS